MSEPNESKGFDPFEAWRGVRDAGMDAWAKAMVDMVRSESYAKASGAMLDAYLTGSAPFREMIEKTMTHALEQLSMPTRADIISLAERMTNVETRLDDMDAKIDLLLEQERHAAPSKAPRKEPK